MPSRHAPASRGPLRLIRRTKSRCRCGVCVYDDCWVWCVVSSHTHVLHAFPFLSIPVHPHNTVPPQAWARLEASLGDMPQARQLFSRALGADPANAVVLQAWAVAEGDAGDLDRARALFAQALEARPGSAYVHQAWGCMEMEAGALPRARELLHKALSVQPDNVAVLTALGRC